MKLVSSPATAPRRTFEIVSNTPVPVSVVTLLGEDTARIPRKQALRTAAIEANAAKEKAASAEVSTTQEPATPPEHADSTQTVAPEPPSIEAKDEQSGG